MVWYLNGWGSIPTEYRDHQDIFDDLNLIARKSGEGEAYRDLLPDVLGTVPLAVASSYARNYQRGPLLEI